MARLSCPCRGRQVFDPVSFVVWACVCASVCARMCAYGVHCRVQQEIELQAVPVIRVDEQVYSLWSWTWNCGLPFEIYTAKCLTVSYPSLPQASGRKGRGVQVSTVCTAMVKSGHLDLSGTRQLSCTFASCVYRAASSGAYSRRLWHYSAPFLRAEAVVRGFGDGVDWAMGVEQG
ncbi:hypothetical protein F4861DRAFT_490927 [Xylaria intraflava]|nr:hypothetical protein F4861DRAFT_490927 [Xylaria intraflava]